MTDRLHTPASLIHCLEIAESSSAEAVFIRRFRIGHGIAVGEAARSRRDNPRLRGVPVTIKNNIDVAGYPTSAGAALLAQAAPAGSDAPVVARLRGAGAVLLGHTNMTEFAFSGLGINPHFGTPANPAYPAERHIPGGSSSGAAVSVALGIAPVAIGTDTGGSVRIPAALCGLAGFKSTARAVPTAGVVPLSITLDSMGVIAGSVADCRTVFEVIRDAGPGGAAAPVPLLPAALRLAVVRGYVDEDLEPPVQRAVDSSLRRLREAGIALTDIEIPELAQIPEMNARGTLSAAEAWAWHRKYLPANRDRYDPRVLARIERGATISAETYRDLLQERAVFARAFTLRITPFDAVLWPTVPITAPPLQALTDRDAYDRCNLRVLRNPTIVNLADGCAISLPCPDSPQPVGITLAAPRGHDLRLLAVAALVEQALRGHAATRPGIADFVN
ncbi:MAG: amidase [Proteobacteria bacterium]|nr:amidase [Pseudomonadota bacterium]